MEPFSTNAPGEETVIPPTPDSSPASACPTLLVIGYGNELRSDDAAGPRVAEAIRARSNSQLTALAVHQLTPELAGLIANFDGVIFVDAATDADAVQLRPVSASRSGDMMAHVSDPAGILSLAAIAFEKAPRAWQVTIPVENLDYGETISERTRTGIADALSKIVSHSHWFATKTDPTNCSKPSDNKC